MLTRILGKALRYYKHSRRDGVNIVAPYNKSSLPRKLIQFFDLLFISKLYSKACFRSVT